MSNIKLYCGDCLELYKNIKEGSVDLVLIDPPYGIFKDCIMNKISKHGDIKWDTQIPNVDFFNILNYLLRENGKACVFCQEPFTSDLIVNKQNNIDFNYRLVWKKNNCANILGCKTAPVSYFEDIAVFHKIYKPYDFNHPLREYFYKLACFIGKSPAEIEKDLGHRKASHNLAVGRKTIEKNDKGEKVVKMIKNDIVQFSICTESTYLELIEYYHIDRMVGFRLYKDIAEENNRFLSEKRKNSNAYSIFNLNGLDSKSNILDYPIAFNGYHPTQKPVALLEDLILTYSNENDVVCDFTMGSGSTGVACRNTKRQFVGIEQDEKFCKIARMRIFGHIHNSEEEKENQKNGLLF